MESQAKVNPEELARKALDAFAAYKRHDLGPYLAMLASDYVAHDPFAGDIKGKETIRQTNEQLFTTFPDFEFRDVKIAARGDTLAIEYIISGTFKGPLELGGRTVPPTGARVESRAATFYRLNSKGLASEGRNYYYDFAGFLRQLGLKA
jgi:ketosteroid isomerase-like protein